MKIGHLQGNWHLDLAKDKNRRSPGACAFLARDFCLRDRICKAVHSLAFLPSLLPYMPSCPNCKLQMQNRWMPLLELFSKLGRVQFMKYFAENPKTQNLETPTKILAPKFFGFGVHFPKNFCKTFQISFTSNLTAHVQSIKYR